MLLHNLSGHEFWVRRGDRIAQLIVEKVMEVEVQQVENLTETSRGRRGLGSTGLERLEPGASFSMRSVRRMTVDSQPQTGGSSTTRNQNGGSSATMGENQEEIHHGPLSSSMTLQSPVPQQSSMSMERSTTLSSSRPLTSQRIDVLKQHRGMSAIQSHPSVIAHATSGAATQPSVIAQATSGAATQPSVIAPATAEDERKEPMSSASHSENDLVPSHPTREVVGCPGFLRWDRLIPKEWTSKPGESMEMLMDRSGLYHFWPIKDPRLMELVAQHQSAPERDRWMEIMMTPTVTLMVRIHSAKRRRIYDFEDGAMNGKWRYGRLHLTMAFSEDGRFHLASGVRMGRSSSYLDGPWTGVTLFLKAKTP